MSVIRVTRTLKLPDPVRLTLYKRSPDLGPKILFFSGGTALRNACYELIRYTHNSIHIITPFDSGGSSAVIREAFQMPAVGDVRNRLLALADQSLLGNPEIFRLFAHRFPKNAEQSVLEEEFDQMIRGHHPLVADIHDPMRKIIRHHLSLFRKHQPDDFDLRKASIGNLILTGGYLDNDRHLDPVIFVFSKLVMVRGTVRPVVNKYFHLVAEMDDGEVIVGQHNITGKETEPLSSKIRNVYLSADRENPRPADVPIRDKMRELIQDAELICYPIGSFYSSVIANLLPRGVGSTVSWNPCTKVYVPNTVPDPEAYQLDVGEQINLLIRYLEQDDPGHIAPADVLHFVLMDKERGEYVGRPDETQLNRQGIKVINTPLVSPESSPYIDEKLLVPALLSLV